MNRMDIRVSPIIHHGCRYVGSLRRVRVIVPNLSGNRLLLTETAFEVSPYPDIMPFCKKAAYNMLSRDKETQPHAVLFLRDRKSRGGGNKLTLSFIAKKDDALSNLVGNIQRIYSIL